MTEGKGDWLTRGAVLAVAAVALVRLGQAAAGAIPGTRAAGELGILLATLTVALLAHVVARSAGALGWTLLGAMLVVWSAAVLVPLGLLAYPRAALYDGRLGGATREVSTAPAGRPGRHVIEVTRPKERSGQSLPQGAYVLHVGAGTVSRTLTGGVDAPLDTAEIPLARGQAARLFLERSEVPVLEVRVRPVPLPWTFVQVAGLVAVLLAAIADVALLAARRRLRGLLAAVVAASVIYVALLNPEAAPSGRHALGAAGIAIVAGGLLGAILGPVGAWLRGRWGARAH
ncbi:MAG TPA: hypothetical protein VGQ83_09605 [Polyangia bacterium]|jgi:hypothetical protein